MQFNIGLESTVKSLYSMKSPSKIICYAYNCKSNMHIGWKNLNIITLTCYFGFYSAFKGVGPHTMNMAYILMLACILGNWVVYSWIGLHIVILAPKSSFGLQFDELTFMFWYKLAYFQRSAINNLWKGNRLALIPHYVLWPNDNSSVCPVSFPYDEPYS